MPTTVATVMTADVVSVHDRTSFKEIVEVLHRNRVHGVPVLDAEGRVRGVVSAVDLLLKESEPDAAEHESLLAGPRRRRELRKAAGTVAADVMTAPAHTTTPVSDVTSAAREMRRHQVGRLPVVDPETGRLVGIVSRADLLRVYERPDDEIRRDIIEEIINKWPTSDQKDLKVTVQDGRATLEGRMTFRSHIPVLLRETRRVEGVVAAEAHIVWETDDTLTGHYPYL